MTRTLVIDREHQIRALNMFAAAASLHLASLTLVTRVTADDVRLHVLLVLLTFCAMTADQALRVLIHPGRLAHRQPVTMDADQAPLRLLHLGD